MTFSEHPRRERYYHLAFVFSLWAKAALSAIEVAGGIFAFFVTHEFVVRLASQLTRGELSEDRHDLIANFLMHAARHFSPATQHFTGVFLLSHGGIKLWLVIGLLRERLWYYPTALAVFAGFVIYQLYRFTHTHSPWLLLVTAVDLVVIALTWHEYLWLRDSLHSAHP